MSLIAEPFFILENDLRRNQRHTSWETIVGGVGAIAALGFFITAMVALMSGDVWWALGWFVISIGLVWAIVRLTTAAQTKFMRRQIYPRLASCLPPLRPSPEELTAVIGHIQSKCAKQTKLKDFLPFLEQAHSGVHVAQAVSGR